MIGLRLVCVIINIHYNRGSESPQYDIKGEKFTMSKIIISYNADDTKSASSRLNDYLSSRFGAGIVTLGTHHISDAISAESALSNADSLVIMIGNKWAELGAYQSPEDSDHLAIAAALRLGKLIVPVLVSNAPMPTESTLPPDLHGLAHLNGVPFIAQTVTEDSARIADILASVAKPAPSMAGEQPTFMGHTPTPQGDFPPPNQAPLGQQPYPPPAPKPPVAKTSIPMVDDVTRFVRPLFDRFGTLPSLLVPSAVIFGLWFFLASALSVDRAVRGIIAAVLLAGALYLFFYMLSLVLPKITFKTALMVIVSSAILTFLFVALDRLFIFSLVYLLGSGGIFGFAYSQRNTLTASEGEPRLPQHSAIRFALTISGLVSTMWMLYAYSGGFDAGNRNFAALISGAMFGAALAYVVYDALKDAPTQAPVAPPPSEPIQ